MAVLTRRTWEELRTEHMKRVGREDDTPYQSRAERMLEAAYFDLCLTYHHFELDKTDTSSITLSTSAPSVNLPADCYAVVSFAIRDPETGHVRTLEQQHANFVLANYRQEAAQPQMFARWGSTLRFSVLPDEAYSTTLYYYQIPTAPDFATGVLPVIGRLWDEHVLEGSVARAKGALWRPDLAGSDVELLSDFLDRVAQPSLLETDLPGRPERKNTNRTHGGAQG